MKYERSFNLTLVVTLLLVTGGFTLAAATNVPPTISSIKTTTPKQTSSPALSVEPTEQLHAFNVPANKNDKVQRPEEQQMSEKQSIGSVVPKEKEMTEPLAITSVKSGLAMPKQTNLRVKDSKPLQVTGFITKSGSIYEIEDKDGIGRIEGRQTGDEEATVVCNYGSIVIYSDVPCDQVTSVHIRDIQQQPIDFSQPAANADVTNQTEAAAPMQSEVNAEQANATDQVAENNQNKDELANDSATENKPRRQNQRQRQRQQQNKRRRNHYNGNNGNNANRRRRVQANGNRRREDQLQNTRRQRRPNGQRVQYQNGSARPNNRKTVKRNQQKRRRQQQQQQQQQQKRRRTQSSQQNRRQQQQKRRQTYNNYDDEFESDS